MAPNIEPRRSNRLAKKPKVVIDPNTHARVSIQKPTWTSPRNREQAKQKRMSSVDLEQIEEQLVARKKKSQHPNNITTTKKPQRKRPQVIEESSSEYSEDSSTESDSEDDDSEDEFSMEDDSSESENDFDEDVVGSHDHIEFVNSHDLQNDHGRKYSAESYDSRLEDGNDVYEQDDFVVDDEESVVYEYSDESESGEPSSNADEDDLEVNMTRDPIHVGYQYASKHRRASSIFTDAARRRRSSTPLSSKTGLVSRKSPNTDRRRRSNTAIFPKTTHTPRRPSNIGSSHRRSSSPLFFSDLVGDPTIPERFGPWSPTSENELEDILEAPLIEKASEEVLEEIIDAIALFSRRANKHRPHIRLRLAAAVLEDGEIRETLESSIRAGLGRKLSLADGSKRLSIGPKGR